jgi:hypothetical protein
MAAGHFFIVILANQEKSVSGFRILVPVPTAMGDYCGACAANPEIHIIVHCHADQ